MSSEAKVGFFVFIGMVLLFLLATQVGSFKNISKDGYRIYADFENVAGLDINSKIKANGIDIGYIEDFKIVGNLVKATMFIYKDIKLPSNSTVKPQQESMLGGKYVSLILGDSPELLKDSDIIKSARSSMDFNDASNAITEASNEFKALSKELREILSGETGESLRLTFINLEKITSELREFTKLNKLNQTADNFNKMAVEITDAGDSFGQIADSINKKLPSILNNLDILVQDLKLASANIRDQVPHLSQKFNDIEREIRDIISTNKKPINSAISSAEFFFQSGAETFEKVDNLLNIVDKVQLEVAFGGEYTSKDRSNRGYLSLNYLPSDTKAFQFDIISMDDFSRADSSGRVILPKKQEKDKILFSAQIAKRYQDLVLRAGLIESSAGAGVDYFMFNDRFKASAEIYDFNSLNDLRGDNPHAKIKARYTFLKHLDFYAGYDNFLNRRGDNAFIGLGVRFFDNDLKNLIMTQSLGNLAR